MTAAVCLKCGAMKVGAWTPCPECRYEPETEEEKAKAILASDHNLSPGDLKEVSKRVKEGGQINFVPEQVESLAAGIDDFQNDPEEKRRLRNFMLKMGLGCFGVILAMVAMMMAMSMLFGWGAETLLKMGLGHGPMLLVMWVIFLLLGLLVRQVLHRR